jgi:hypothetical protein
VHDSFGAYDHLIDPVLGKVSVTNEAIKDRQVRVGLVWGRGDRRGGG